MTLEDEGGEDMVDDVDKMRGGSRVVSPSRWSPNASAVTLFRFILPMVSPKTHCE